MQSARMQSARMPRPEQARCSPPPRLRNGRLTVSLPQSSVDDIQPQKHRQQQADSHCGPVQLQPFTADPDAAPVAVVLPRSHILPYRSSLSRRHVFPAVLRSVLYVRLVSVRRNLRNIARIACSGRGISSGAGHCPYCPYRRWGQPSRSSAGTGLPASGSVSPFHPWQNPPWTCYSPA